MKVTGNEIVIDFNDEAKKLDIIEGKVEGDMLKSVEKILKPFDWAKGLLCAIIGASPCIAAIHWFADHKDFFIIMTFIIIAVIIDVIFLILIHRKNAAAIQDSFIEQRRSIAVEKSDFVTKEKLFWKDPNMSLIWFVTPIILLKDLCSAKVSISLFNRSPFSFRLHGISGGLWSMKNEEIAVITKDPIMDTLTIKSGVEERQRIVDLDIAIDKSKLSDFESVVRVEMEAKISFDEESEVDKAYIHHDRIVFKTT